MVRKLNIRLLIRLSLFCLMLAMQGSVLAHEIDHLSSSDTASCVSCVLGSTLGSAAFDDSIQGVVIPRQRRTAATPGEAIASPQGLISLARAPPLSV